MLLLPQSFEYQAPHSSSQGLSVGAATLLLPVAARFFSESLPHLLPRQAFWFLGLFCFPCFKDEPAIPSPGSCCARQDRFPAPSDAVEDAIVAHIGLQVVPLQMRTQRATEIVRRRCLAQGADVVAASFHRQKCGVADLARIDLAPAMGKIAGREFGLLEYPVDGLDIEFLVRSSTAKYSS